jgi:hypothetical protein
MGNRELAKNAFSLKTGWNALTGSNINKAREGVAGTRAAVMSGHRGVRAARVGAERAGTKISRAENELNAVRKTDNPYTLDNIAKHEKEIADSKKARDTFVSSATKSAEELKAAKEARKKAFENLNSQKALTNKVRLGAAGATIGAGGLTYGLSQK